MNSHGSVQVDITHQQLSEIIFSDLHECYKQYPELEQYYHSGNSSIWQMFGDECPDWVHQTAKKLILAESESEKYVVSLVKVDPGNTIPNHRDTHYMVQNQYGTGTTARYLIFLTDWQTGHYFEIHDQPFVNWNKGDWIRFSSADWHLAGNMGDKPFYSMQVTVLVSQ